MLRQSLKQVIHILLAIFTLLGNQFWETYGDI